MNYIVEVRKDDPALGWPIILTAKVHRSSDGFRVMSADMDHKAGSISTDGITALCCLSLVEEIAASATGLKRVDKDEEIRQLQKQIAHLTSQLNAASALSPV